MENHRVREPSILKSLRFSRELWEQIIEFEESENCNDFSDAVRKLIDEGLWLENHKKQLQDPQQNQKVIDEYNQKLKDESALDWLDTMTKLQIEGLESAINLVKEKKFS